MPQRLRTSAGTETWPPREITSRFTMTMRAYHEEASRPVPTFAAVILDTGETGKIAGGLPASLAHPSRRSCLFVSVQDPLHRCGKCAQVVEVPEALKDLGVVDLEIAVDEEFPLPCRLRHPCGQPRVEAARFGE